MGYEEILQHVLAYIDENIQAELTAAELAKLANFSVYHFHRIFQWNVGYSLMEYVRIRRLNFAAAALVSGRKIIDIAVDYGFETHSGFSKAFKRYYGLPPEKYRLHATGVKPALPLLKETQKYAIGGIIMEPKFVTLPDVRLAGYTLLTNNNGGQNNSEIPAFWGAYLSDRRTNRLHNSDFVKDHAEYGACFAENPETGDFTYMIGVEAKDGASIPAEFDVRYLPAATYAVFSTPPSDAAGFSSSIQGTWSYIMNEWFPSSGYAFAQGCVDFELYNESCMKENGKSCDIYIPIVKATEL